MGRGRRAPWLEDRSADPRRSRRARAAGAGACRRAHARAAFRPAFLLSRGRRLRADAVGAVRLRRRGHRGLHPRGLERAGGRAGGAYLTLITGSCRKLCTATRAATADATAPNALAEAESGLDATTGVPLSPPSRTNGSRGIAPR